MKSNHYFAFRQFLLLIYAFSAAAELRLGNAAKVSHGKKEKDFQERSHRMFERMVFQTIRY